MISLVFVSASCNSGRLFFYVQFCAISRCSLAVHAISANRSSRRFALLLDPETASDPIPTAYLYHLRPPAAPTFDRQYYVAFDITPLWALPSTQGLRIRLANSASPSLSTLLFQK